MDDALTERVEALERAVTDGEHDLSKLATESEALDRIDRLEHRQDELEDRVAELEAATQALRGYVGNVRAVNEEVENRAETALAKVESLEATVSGRGEGASTDSRTRPRQDDGFLNSDSGSSAKQRPTGSSNPGQQPSSQSGRKFGADAGRENTGTERCNACGRTQPDTEPAPESASNRVENSHTCSRGEPDGDSAEQLREDDPLVSEETDKSQGTLSRFKRLL